MPSTCVPVMFVVSLIILMVSVLVACLCIAWRDKTIDHGVIPYISDLGFHKPEMYVFRQLFNVAVFTGMVVMILRYVVTQVDPLELRLEILSKVACSLGIIALFGLSLVANFRECIDVNDYNDHKYNETVVITVHDVGAGVLFFAGLGYAIIDSAMTLLLAWQRDGSFTGVSMRWYCRVRPVLAVIAFGTIILGIVGFSRKPNRTCHDQHNLIQPNLAYIEFAVAEWLGVAVFLLYNATFIPEFLNHPMTLSAVRRQADRVLMLHPDAVHVLPAEPHEGSRLNSRDVHQHGTFG